MLTKMHNLVSVIITAYNLENYLSGAIDSVIFQTYSNIEIIIVDDGSIDKTPLICDEYAKKDKRIIVIHKKNGGVSSARNAALNIAKGDYICFLDGDDALKVNYIELMINMILESKCDFVACTYVDCFTVDERNIISRQIQTTNVTTYYSQTDYLKAFLTHKCSPSSCEKIFDSRTIRNIRFREDIKINEDKYFQFQVLMNSKRIGYSNLKMYICLNRKGSVSRNNNNYRLDQIIIADCIYNEIKKSPLNSKLEYYGKYNLCLTLLYSVRTLYRKKITKVETQYYYKKLKEKYNVLKQFIFKELSFKNRLEFFLAFNCSCLYKVIIKYVLINR